MRTEKQKVYVNIRKKIQLNSKKCIIIDITKLNALTEWIFEIHPTGVVHTDWEWWGASMLGDPLILSYMSLHHAQIKYNITRTQ